MRKRRAEKRFIKPDPKFNDLMVAKFTNALMLQGKKSTARKIIYDAFNLVEEKTKKPGLDVFQQAITNVQPLIEVKSRRVGGATYQVPIEVRESRKEALSMRWIIQAARNRSGKSMSENLSSELLDAFNSTGTAFKKKEDTHRMAEANKAFSHYRW